MACVARRAGGVANPTITPPVVVPSRPPPCRAPWSEHMGKRKSGKMTYAEVAVALLAVEEEFCEEFCEDEARFARELREIIDPELWRE